jgi:hypothetical protein
MLIKKKKIIELVVKLAKSNSNKYQYPKLKQIFIISKSPKADIREIYFEYFI